MRFRLAVVAALLMAGSVSWVAPAEAGLRKYMICWMTPDSVGDCAWLPRGYHLSFVEKPYCNRAQRCKRGRVSFTLTHARIRHLGRYVATDTMYPTHTATIYAPNR